jgi:ABC-type transporter Mla maintaining outer membrane lipid asymmetry ATPase subunit MlaF
VSLNHVSGRKSVCFLFKVCALFKSQTVIDVFNVQCRKEIVLNKRNMQKGFFKAYWIVRLTIAWLFMERNLLMENAE